MIRWKYLLPRLGILLILILLVNLLSSPLTRWLMVHSAQRITGAKVDIDSVELSLWNGNLNIKGLQVADPRYPMQNLIQADSAEFQIDSGQLLNRQWIIDKAKLNRVQFGTPRTESGRLTSGPPANQVKPAFIDNILSNRLKPLGQYWLNEISGQVPGLIEGQLETVQIAKKLRKRWPREFQRERHRAQQLKQRVTELALTIENGSGNPLREIEKFQKTISELRQVYDQVEQAKGNLHRLSDQFKQDKQDVIAAKQRDQTKIQSVATRVTINPQSISEILLEKQKLATVREAISWIRWFRDSIPNPEKDFQPNRSRGFDVQFRRHPNFIIRSIALHGEGSVAGQNIRFAGVAKNIASHPTLYELPASFELRGQGQTHILVSATVDRRGPQKVDVFEISCPRITLPATVLGQEDSLAIALQPSEMSFQIHATIVDDQINCQISADHSNVQMRVEQIHESIGDHRLVNSLNRQIGQIDRFDLSIEVDGALDNPDLQLSSDLGGRFAKALDHCLQSTVEQTAKTNLAKLDSILEQQLNELDRMFSVNADEIINMLVTEIPAVADLNELNRGNRLSWPKIR